MKLTKNISFKNYKNLKTNKKILNFLDKIKKENNEILKSMNSTYKDSVSKKKILEYKKYKLIRLFGMGGSSLGAKAFLSIINSDRISFLESLDPSRVLNLLEKYKKKSGYNRCWEYGYCPLRCIKTNT